MFPHCQPSSALTEPRTEVGEELPAEKREDRLDNQSHSATSEEPLVAASGIVKRKRGRPRKDNAHKQIPPTPDTITDSLTLRSGRVVGHVDSDVDELSLNPDNYSSSIAKHLVSNEACRKMYRDTDFSILSHGRSKFHLKVLEGVYVRMYKPSLCVQKKVWSVRLFPRD